MNTRRVFPLKIFLRILAIVYLLWALFYSVFYAPAWVKDALAFKFNGGPQLVAQLHGAGYSLQEKGVHVDPKDRFIGLSLSRRGLRSGQFVDVTYRWGRDSARKATRKPKAVDPFYPKQFRFVKTRENWALVVTMVKEPGVDPVPERRFVNRLQINPDHLSYHPISEFKLLNQFLVSMIGDQSGLGDPYDIMLHILVRFFFVYPVLLPFALTVALSPPQIAPVTSYLPVLLYAYLLFALTWGLFKRSEN